MDKVILCKFEEHIVALPLSYRPIVDLAGFEPTTYRVKADCKLLMSEHSLNYHHNDCLQPCQYFVPPNMVSVRDLHKTRQRPKVEPVLRLEVCFFLSRDMSLSSGLLFGCTDSQLQLRGLNPSRSQHNEFAAPRCRQISIISSIVHVVNNGFPELGSSNVKFACDSLWAEGNCVRPGLSCLRTLRVRMPRLRSLQSLRSA